MSAISKQIDDWQITLSPYNYLTKLEKQLQYYALRIFKPGLGLGAIKKLLEAEIGSFPASKQPFFRLEIVKRGTLMRQPGTNSHGLVVTYTKGPRSIIKIDEPYHIRWPKTVGPETPGKPWEEFPDGLCSPLLNPGLSIDSEQKLFDILADNGFVALQSDMHDIERIVTRGDARLLNLAQLELRRLYNQFGYPDDNNTLSQIDARLDYILPVPEHYS